MMSSFRNVKTGRTYYDANLYYQNWETFLEGNREMAVLRHFKQQHSVYFSVTTGS